MNQGYIEVANGGALFYKSFQGYEKAIETFINQSNFCRFPPNLANTPKPFAIGRLEELYLPVLIVIDEFDHGFNHETAEILHRSIKNSFKIVMRDCGHLPPIEDPEIFSSHVADFLLKDSRKS